MLPKHIPAPLANLKSENKLNGSFCFFCLPEYSLSAFMFEVLVFIDNIMGGWSAALQNTFCFIKGFTRTD